LLLFYLPGFCLCGFAAFQSRFILLPSFHAQASVLAFASGHKSPK
jgi:hypothetical protein